MKTNTTKKGIATLSLSALLTLQACALEVADGTGEQAPRPRKLERSAEARALEDAGAQLAEGLDGAVLEDAALVEDLDGAQDAALVEDLDGAVLEDAALVEDLDGCVPFFNC